MLIRHGNTRIVVSQSPFRITSTREQSRYRSFYDNPFMVVSDNLVVTMPKKAEYYLKEYIHLSIWV